MLSYFRNYKLNKFLSESWVTTHPDDRIILYSIQNGYNKVFDVSTGQGRQNYLKLISLVYSEKDEKIRLKMLMLIHFLLKQHPQYSDIFLENYQNQFGGSVSNYSNKHSSYIYSREKNTQSKLTSTSFTSIGSGNFQSAQSIQSMPSLKNCEDEYSDLNNYIYLHMVIPYHSYLIRMASSQQRYHICLSQLQHKTSVYNSNECWKFLNVLKSVSIMKIPITNVGRYYKQEIKSAIDLIEMISFDLIVYKTELQKQLQNAFASYWELEKNEIESVVLQTEELLKQNQNLFEIFHNRYYQSEPVHQVKPRWFEVEEGALEIIEDYYSTAFASLPEAAESKTYRSIATTSHSIKYQ